MTFGFESDIKLFKEVLKKIGKGFRFDGFPGFCELNVIDVFEMLVDNGLIECKITKKGIEHLKKLDK